MAPFQPLQAEKAGSYSISRSPPHHAETWKLVVESPSGGYTYCTRTPDLIRGCFYMERMRQWRTRIPIWTE